MKGFENITDAWQDEVSVGRHDERDAGQGSAESLRLSPIRPHGRDIAVSRNRGLELDRVEIFVTEQAP